MSSTHTANTSHTSTIGSIGAPSRRDTELALLVFAVVIPVFAYANVGLAISGEVPSGLLGYGLGLGLFAGIGHLVVRKFAPYADPLLLPLATLLNGLGQLEWFTPAGTTPDGTYWGGANNHALAWRIDGSEFADSASALYVAYNGWSGDVSFTLPAPPAGRQWYRVTDTSTWAEGPNQVATPGSEALIGGTATTYLLHGRGLLLLIAK